MSEVRPLRAVGRYLLFGELAAGGMASVHLGRLVGPVGFSRTVAIKRLHPQLARDAEGVSAFLDEARLTARVHHPNVVQTIDVVEQPGELFIVMEYVRGETLSRLVRAASARGERVPVRIALAIVVGALYGLHAAHEAKNEKGQPLGIVHRDVSPQNVIVGIDGVARVLDFGVAKAIGRVQSTSEGQVKGKLAYMPPEQIASGQVDRRTDVYAAAVVLWETLTARRLFEGESQGHVIGKILRNEYERPRKWAPELPEDLERVVVRGLAKDPDERYPTALEMAIDLEKHGLASPREVGAWVEKMAGDVLSKRASLIEEIESASYNDLSLDELKRQARETSGSIDVAAEQATRTDSSLHVAPPSSPTAASSSVAVDPRVSVPAPKSKRGVVLAIVGGLAVVALVVGAFVLGSRREAPPPVVPAAQPTASAPAPHVSPEPPAASVAAAPASPPPATPPPSASTPSPVSPVEKKAARPAAPRRDCNPPYSVDKDGIRHMKPECFQ